MGFSLLRKMLSAPFRLATPDRRLWHSTKSSWKDAALRFAAEPPDDVMHLSSGAFGLEIVGESAYQPALWRACRLGQRWKNGVVVPVVVVSEPDNPYDDQAVAVRLPDGSTIGYLSRERAPSYHRLLREIEEEGKTVVCWASLFGGVRGKEHLGAWLSLWWPERIAAVIAHRRDEA